MRTRRSQSSGNPASPFDNAHGKPLDEAQSKPHGHTPVLLHEVVDMLDIRPDDTVVDATLGGAGHASALARRLGEKGTFIGFDLDQDAIARAESALADAKASVHLVQANFRTMRKALATLGVTQVSKVLFDLGMSSYQLDGYSGLPAEASAKAGRGFSFLRDEPLRMTYSKEGAAFTARDVVNSWEEGSLADVIYGWGEERYARRIAKAIVEARTHRPIETAHELAEIVKQAVPSRARHGRIHPATKTFQALRIAVNDELGALAEGLQAAWEALAPGGRIAVISFHSLEDRAVKQAFADIEKRGEGTRLSKKPIVPSEEEVAENPRARSAKLRVIEKNQIPTLA